MPVSTGMTTFLLVPGAGGDGWFWDRLVAALADRGHRGIAVTLPGPDESAGLAAYADVIVDAGRDAGPLVLVAQSMGGFSAPLAVDRLDVERIALINAMVPAPGETAGSWWETVGQAEAAGAAARRDGRSEEFDVERDFFHDVPEAVTRELFSRPMPDEAERAFADPWPLDAWPDVPTTVLAGADDRLFPPELQQRVARERLGIDADVVPGGHLVALADPDLVADWLTA
ncbi:MULTISPECIES: alpha/beta fold hydrolase [unclassified Nocardioides]|uniref:alpha/beta fold hydrolase n=1 Tax=unclassified Nocardioides TaxID=2615069 RepID=UPI001910969E|nr:MULTISPECIES: alpha/beta hydrolase [unclassified Nocardioides]